MSLVLASDPVNLLVTSAVNPPKVKKARKPPIILRKSLFDTCLFKFEIGLDIVCVCFVFIKMIYLTTIRETAAGIYSIPPTTVLELLRS